MLGQSASKHMQSLALPGKKKERAKYSWIVSPHKLMYVEVLGPNTPESKNRAFKEVKENGVLQAGPNLVLLIFF